jgi:hypothetical protein
MPLTMTMTMTGVATAGPTVYIQMTALAVLP